MRQDGFDFLPRDRKNGFRFGRCRAALLETRNGLKGLQDGWVKKLVLNAPFEHPPESHDLLVNEGPRPSESDHLLSNTLELQGSELASEFIAVEVK